MGFDSDNIIHGLMVTWRKNIISDTTKRYPTLRMEKSCHPAVSRYHSRVHPFYPAGTLIIPYKNIV